MEAKIDRSDVKAYLTDEVYALIRESKTMAPVAREVIDENRQYPWGTGTALSEEVEASSAFFGIRSALLDMVDWTAIVDRLDADR